VFAAFVNKVDINAVDVSQKIIKLTKSLFKTTEVVVITPIVQEFGLITQRNTLAPVFYCLGLRKARLLESLHEIFNQL
jgi:hypothetical protein